MVHISFIATQQLGSPMQITRFGGATKSTEEHLQLALTADHGSTKNRLILSTYHWYMKEGLNGKPIKIAANP